MLVAGCCTLILVAGAACWCCLLVLVLVPGPARAVPHGRCRDTASASQTMSAEHSEVAVAPVPAVVAAESSLTRPNALVLVSLFATAIFLNAALLFSVQPLFT